MKTRKWPSLLLAVFTVLSFGACDDWGQMDPAAGNQIYPKQVVPVPDNWKGI